MRIVLNGETVEAPAETLADLLARHEFEVAVVATAVNGEFVPRAARQTTRLRDGDTVVVVSPRQGG